MCWLFKNKILLSAEKTILINIDIFHVDYVNRDSWYVCSWALPSLYRSIQPYTTALP